MPSEFDIIKQLASSQSVCRDEVILGIGDDAAILNIPPDYELVISTDTLNVGVHFPEDTRARDIGYKSLAVSLSDMAAMGAEPVAVNLSMSLPEPDPQWISGFAEGLFSLADQHNVQLSGGDTTRGPLSISMTIFGMVSKGRALRRSTAGAGDSIFVTGTLGDAGAALLGLLGELKLNGPQQLALNERLNRPQPRVAMGQALMEIAS
ncbi:MAG: thiamine-phosphate kinase, partial [Gammaproteobacteria bacterium]|nr:thiamine-phosphate kinase [Gammaproteobacteria bacterium]